MNARVKYVDVVVPLPLPKLLTYSLEEDQDEVVAGMRVVVQVGTRKRHIAIVWKVHDEAPVDYVPEATRISCRQLSCRAPIAEKALGLDSQPLHVHAW